MKLTVLILESELERAGDREQSLLRYRKDLERQLHDCNQKIEDSRNYSLELGEALLLLKGTKNG